MTTTPIFDTWHGTWPTTWTSSSPTIEPVDVVAHSMGGLIVRFALAKQSVGAWPALEVEDVITLGSPHGGVNFASWNGTVQGNQMEPNSFVIGWLADHAAQPARHRWH